MKKYTDIYTEIQGKIAVVKLDRTTSANALSTNMLAELSSVIDEINEDKSIVTTIFVGSGDKVFCAGADLKERRNMSPDEVQATVQLIGETLTKISKMNMPTIAAINGAALGGGLELALCCDLRITSEEGILGLPETTLAIIPGAGGTQRLARLVGLGQAKKMIFSGQPITGRESYSIGLVEVLVESNKLVLDEALKLANQISENGPIALKLAKTAIDEGYDQLLSEGLEIEKNSYLQTIETKDREEGLLAFKEKRKPSYKGK